MRPGRRIFVALVACSVWLGAMPFLPGLRVAAEDEIPSRLTDKAFWQLINDLSEPGGYFRSDNFLSNENAFQTVIPELKTTLRSGGVYLGVGPEQNFTYIVGHAPQARVHHRHPPRQPGRAAALQGVRRRCRRPAPNSCPACSPGSARSISRPTRRSRRCSPRSPAAAPSADLFKENLQAARDRLVRDHKFTLSADDLKTLEYVYSAFYRGGPDLNYSFSPSGAGAGFGVGFPSYADLMTETDGQGEQRSYLATEENFRILREYQRNNAIVPVVGDFGGDKALRAVGDYVRSHGATVTAFYTSNVEQYLFQEAYAWRKFLQNVATFPIDTKSTFIRSISNRGFPFTQFRRISPSARASTALSPIHEVVKAFNGGQIHRYEDVVAMSK